ncbi:MAG TPA: hypothetical protein PLM53_11050 [Spirochaetota bacterium]|nr:hypothetical protein [Spirochaetota bacterium]HPL15628.1 hypothetical protein [Spirochaetota bacterium]HQF09147.1 hypothetical protein [Spirochaetota bacterium]HQH97628.1 hypothetical protein [Spirochaetota bacterium]HQJ71392.1 hypothetical protein [Spirochaetota bacterium]
MNDTHACARDRELLESQGAVHCTVCNKEIDYLTSLVSGSPQDAIYICFESIKQKIFVYGKYLGGTYGALQIKKYYTRDECGRKVCEDDMRALLAKDSREEYSRLVTCTKGNMESIILTRDIIDARKRDLTEGRLRELFNNPNSEKKYYCHEHATQSGLVCQCGAELIQLGSEKHRDLTGMEDQKFVETYLREVLSF